MGLARVVVAGGHELAVFQALKDDRMAVIGVPDMVLAGFHDLHSSFLFTVHIIADRMEIQYSWL